MPRYFFNLRKSDDRVDDRDGAEYADLEQARVDAILSAREIVAEWAWAGKPVDGSEFQITDETGRVVLTVPFQAVIDHG
jgi:hypothetical protein